MRALLDACVLYPGLMRRLLLLAAAHGHITPLWSERILQEWARAMARGGPAAGHLAREEIARLSARWPTAMVDPAPLALVLPDPADVHVVAAAVSGQARLLVTRNHRDFPGRALARLGLARADPDPLLRSLAAEDEDFAADLCATVSELAPELPLRAAMKRAGLPRLARLIAGGSGQN